MLVVQLTAALLLTLCNEGLSAYPDRSEKPLFVPTFNYPTLIHFNPLSYGSVENSALYPHYVYDHGHEYWDSLQRQLPYQDAEKRLESFLLAGKAKKLPSREQNEDDYKHSANKLSLDEVKPDLDDLDLKFKRSLTFNSYTPPMLSSTNTLDDRIPPPASRSVPFGPYTTWLPLEDPPTMHLKSVRGTGATPSATKTHRHRRDVIYAPKDIPQALLLPQDYHIEVPISYSSPIVRNVPFVTGSAPSAEVFPSAAAPLNTFYAGKLSASLDTIAHNPDLAVSYNVIRK